VVTSQWPFRDVSWLGCVSEAAGSYLLSEFGATPLGPIWFAVPSTDSWKLQDKCVVAVAAAAVAAAAG